MAASSSLSSVRITTLGGGQDIGRSCVAVTLGGRMVLFDCGMHMGYTDRRRFPDFAQLGGDDLTSLIDCVFITHYHLDHCGALPHLTETLGYRGPIYMTAPTMAIARLLLKDYAQIIAKESTSGGSSSAHCYPASAVDTCLQRVTIVALGETIDVGEGLALSTYYAGHVLGAVICCAECRGQRVVYTGDVNTTPDRHLGAARLCQLNPHVLITECTYADAIRESKRCKEAELLHLVHKTVACGGRVLMPCATAGKPQELLLLLTTYWERMGLTVRALLLSTLSLSLALHARAHHTLHALSGYYYCCTCARAVMSPIICQSTDT